MTDPTPLPDFDLAALRGIAPEDLVSPDDPSDIEGFMLALALFYNDWKNLAWATGCLLKPHQRPPTEVSAIAGQLAGMNNHFIRIMIGMMHELLELISRSEAVVTDSEFIRLVTSIPEESRASWKALVSVALDQQGTPNPIRNALLRVRNSVSFHYYNPKSLVRGYQATFFRDPKTQKNQSALCSLGKNMEGTRFYFADAAADAAIKVQASAAGADDFIASFDDLGGKMNFALFSLLKQFVKERDRP